MGRDRFFGVGDGHHGPADHAGGESGAQAGGDSAVRGDAAARDLAGDFVYELEEGVVFSAGGFDGGEAFAGGCGRGPDFSGLLCRVAGAVSLFRCCHDHVVELGSPMVRSIAYARSPAAAAVLLPGASVLRF